MPTGRKHIKERQSGAPGAKWVNSPFVYVGEMNDDGEFHGQGVLELDEYSDYEGQWKNGKRHGPGVFIHRHKNPPERREACYWEGEEVSIDDFKERDAKQKREYIPRELEKRIYKKCDYVCVANWSIDPSLDKNTGEICGSNEHLEIDHIVPHAKGGKSTYRNLQLLCQKHNRMKSDKLPSQQ